MSLFWTLYGLTTLTYAAVFVLRLTLSTSYRRRQSAGGRDWRLVVAVLLSLGPAGLVTGRWSDGRSWPLLPVFVALILVAARRRQRLADVPSETLSPIVRSSLEAPAPADLLRHPLRSTRQNFRIIRKTFTPSALRAERQWEREQGLRRQLDSD